MKIIFIIAIIVILFAILDDIVQLFAILGKARHNDKNAAQKNKRH